MEGEKVPSEAVSDNFDAHHGLPHGGKGSGDEILIHVRLQLRKYKSNALRGHPGSSFPVPEPTQGWLHAAGGGGDEGSGDFHLQWPESHLPRFQSFASLPFKLAPFRELPPWI